MLLCQQQMHDAPLLPATRFRRTAAAVRKGSRHGPRARRGRGLQVLERTSAELEGVRAQARLLEDHLRALRDDIRACKGVRQ